MTQQFRQRGGIGPGIVGRVGSGKGPAQVLSVAQLRRLGLGTAAAAAQAVGQSLIAGTNIILTDNGDGTFTIAASGGSASEPREGSVTKPLAANFTQANFRASTAGVDGVTGIIMTDTGAALTAFHLLEQTAAVPATPWTIYTRFEHGPLLATSQAGLVIRNSTSGKLVFFGFEQNSINVGNWTNFTTFSSNPFLTALAGNRNYPKWWRINNDGTTLTFDFSIDGRDWIRATTQTLASFIVSVDRIGFGIQTDQGAGSWLRCSSFGFVAPV